MKIGYARVSTNDQNFDLQVDALKKAGCKIIFKETISGVKKDRPELAKALDKLREEDSLVVWKLDRLGRSLKELIDIVTKLKERKIGFESLSDNLNTSTSQGRLIFNIFGSLAEFERELIRERTNAGLIAARARGRKGGRRRGMTPEAENKAILAASYYDAGKLGVNEIARQIGVSKMTLYKYLRYKGVTISQYKNSTNKN